MREAVSPEIEFQPVAPDCGRFVVEPLEPGYGLTLGNAMRRILLSSLRGAAVTAVRIDGVQHEFSTIPHMKEDTMEFLLNVKGIRLRYLSNRTDTLTLEVNGEGIVRAGDIKPSSSFEIVNPEHYLATLDSPDARLNVEFIVEIGTGYMMAGSNEGQPIGLLPIDAVFTPVRRVNYKVEKTRVEDRSDYDRLVLDVWTDGTITPEDAVAESARILMRQFAVFANIGKLPEEAVEEVEEAPAAVEERYDIPLEQLGLSSRTFNALRRGGISTTAALLEKTKDELLGLKNFGEKSWNEVRERLISLGLVEEAEGEREEEGEPEMTSEEAPSEGLDFEEMKRKLQERFQVRDER